MANATDDSSPRQKLRRLLVRSVPGLIPWFGDLWKDAFDEFTDQDVEKALKRLEAFAQADAKTQRALLFEVLAIKDISAKGQNVMARFERRERRDVVLGKLLETDWGNARWLFGILSTSEGRRMCEVIDIEFRKDYPQLLEELADEVHEPGQIPFLFHMYPAGVAFPEQYDSYAWRFRNPPLRKEPCPVLITEADVVPDGDDFYFEGGVRTPLPQLPLRSGFIHEVDASSSGLPTAVGDVPNPRWWNAFYWVHPRGLRSVVGGIGVADPLEATYGTAVWWDYLDARPFFGHMIVDRTLECPAARREFLLTRYRQLLRKYSEGKDAVG